MPNEIDHIMSRDPLDLSAQDIDKAIAYWRQARAAYASGIKPKKSTSSEPIDLDALGLTAAPTQIKRRKF